MTVDEEVGELTEEITPLRPRKGLRRVQGTRGEVLAEFIGCVVLIALGDGMVAMAVAALPGSGRTASPTTIFTGVSGWLTIIWGWAFAAFAMAFAVRIAGGVSGPRINPAVTFAFALRRKFPWRKVPAYVLAQVTGCFVGAAIVYANYHNAVDADDRASHVWKHSGHAVATFSTFPAAYFHGDWYGPLTDQVIGTVLLLMLVAAVIDIPNLTVGANLGPLVIGFALAAIGLSFGANAGYTINPARDFGRRPLAWIAGWGAAALPGTVKTTLHFSDYVWIPIVGPLIGGTVGLFLYNWFVGDVLHARGLLAERQ